MNKTKNAFLSSSACEYFSVDMRSDSQRSEKDATWNISLNSTNASKPKDTDSSAGVTVFPLVRDNTADTTPEKDSCWLVVENTESDLEALEHVEVLLSELEVLGQQPEGFHLVELSGSEEAKDEVVVRPQETDVRPRHDHVPNL